MKSYFLLFCLFLVACTSSSPDKQTTSKDYFTIDFQPLLKHPAEKKTLTQWAKQIHYLPLQMSDSLSIQSIQQLFLRNDTFLVVHNNQLSLFNSKGKWLYNIGRKGKKEEEYIQMYGVVLRNDSIFVVDGNYNFTLYNWKGTYLGKYFHPKIRHTKNFFPIPKSDIFLGHIENNTGQKETRFVFFKDTNILKTIPNTEKYEPTSPGIVITIPFEMRPFGGLVPAFKELFNDTIYQVDSQLNLCPYAVIQLGHYKATKKAIFDCTAEQLMKNGFDFFNGKVALTAIGEKDDMIYMAHYNIKDPYTYSYDKKTGQAYFQEISYPENKYNFKQGSTFVPHFISTDGKYLIDYEIPENGGNTVLILVER